MGDSPAWGPEHKWPAKGTHATWQGVTWPRVRTETGWRSRVPEAWGRWLGLGCQSLGEVKGHLAEGWTRAGIRAHGRREKGVVGEGPSQAADVKFHTGPGGCPQAEVGGRLPWVCVCVSTEKAEELQPTDLGTTDLGTRTPWRNSCLLFSGGESTR